MKKYFLNSGTGKLHITEFADKRCKGKMLAEHCVYYDSVEDAEKNSDRKIKKCKLCFYKSEWQK